MVRPENSCSSALEAPPVRERYQLSPPWKPLRRYSLGVDRELAVGQPFACGDLGGRRHLLRHAGGHVVGQVHDVVGRHLGELGRRSSRRAGTACCLSSRRSCGGNRRAGNRGRPACSATSRRWPGGSSTTIGNACAAAAARRAPRGSSGWRAAPAALPSVAKGRSGGPANGALINASERNTSGRTSAHQAATDGAEIVADHRRDLAVAERRDQAQRVAHRVEHAERGEIVVVIGAPAGGAAVAALIGRDDVKPGLGQRHHDLAPGIGDLGKAVQQQQARPAGLVEAGFEDVHVEAVDPVDKAGADAGGQHRAVKRSQFGHHPLPSRRLSPTC